MSKLFQPRIMRNYRNMTPSRFHTLNQRVRKSISDQKIPVSTWAGNPTLISSYCTASDKHDAVHHEAVYGSILVIAEREVLEKQIITLLDEIALLLEAAAVRNPELLLISGFDLTKERRSSARTKPVQAVSEVSTAEGQGNHP